MGKIKAIKWDSKKASEVMLGKIDEFNKYQNASSANRRENENVYTSNFYNNSSDILGMRFTPSGMKEVDSDWITHAKFNHTFTFVRLLHSMMISNTPIATASPVDGSDQSREATQCSDKLIRWGKDKYKVKEFIDNQILHTLIYGIGCLRVDYNGSLGELIDVNLEDDLLTYKGDLELRNVLPDNYMLFSTTTALANVYGYLERIFLDKEEAEAMFPDYTGKFETTSNINQTDILTGEVMPVKDKVVLFEYYEKGTPFNAKLGRYVLCTEKGEVLKLSENPQLKRRLPIALLPDIIVPNRLMPLSILDYLRDPQKQINDLMSRVLENVKLYSKVFMLVDRSAKLNEDALTDSPLIPVEYNSSEGGRPPAAMNPPSLPAFIFKSYDMLVDMMQHISGIRDFSRGVMSKNVSGFATNLMIESDNKVQIQLHERYKDAVKTSYELILDLLYQHLDDNTKISIVGQEDEIDVMSFNKSMMEGGYQVQVDYGTSLPVDPVGRRQAVRELIEFSKGLGVNIDPSKTMDLLKLGDLMGAYDLPKAARKRQREEVKSMSSSGQYVPVSYDTDDHILHYSELFGYFQSKEYASLQEAQKAPIKRHAEMHLKAQDLKKRGVTEAQFDALQNGSITDQQLMQMIAPPPPMATSQQMPMSGQQNPVIQPKPNLQPIQ